MQPGLPVAQRDARTTPPVCRVANRFPTITRARSRRVQAGRGAGLRLIPLAKRLSRGVGLTLGWLALFSGFLLSAANAAEGLAWQAAAGCRWASLTVPRSGHTGFTLLAPEITGIRFTNRLADASGARNRILENGSGLALGDVDGDGWCDLYLCAIEGTNVLYRNTGNWKFSDITQAAGVACPGQHSTGAVLADIDGDGDLDLLVNAIGGGTRSFLNDGRGRFTEVTDTRLERTRGSTSMALADIDGDGYLDLYVTNYRTDTYNDRPPGLKVVAWEEDGRIRVSPEGRFIPLKARGGGVEVMEMGEADVLYHNKGGGRFAPISWTAGAFLDEQGEPLKRPPMDWGLSVMFRDLNGDGLPDLYVCNDFFLFPDRVWLNEDSKRFRPAAPLSLRNVSLSSMGVDFADINRDGYDDFFVTDMVSRSHPWRQRQRPNVMKGLVTVPVNLTTLRPEVAHNTLCLNRGDGTYAEIAQLSGVDATEWSWGAIFLDMDMDGYEDLLIPTGSNRDVQDADAKRAEAAAPPVVTAEDRLRRWRSFPPLKTPILAYHNNRDLTFSEMGTNSGFARLGCFQGMALADLDNDGDLDVVANELNGPAAVYRNDTIAPRLAVRLKGAGPNTRGIGAKIRVLGGPVTQSQEMICGGRYLSSDDPLRVFATGTTSNEMTIEVTWRSGRQSRFSRLLPNRVYELDEASAREPAQHTPPIPVQNAPRTHAAPWFVDVSELLGQNHHDEPFDDFARQPLLSRKLSQLGPGAAWVDLDGDGWEDLVVAAGRGGPLIALRNTGQGEFAEMPNAVFSQTEALGLTTVLGWTKAPGATVLLAGAASYDGTAQAGGSVRLYEPTASFPADLFPGGDASVGPLALADIDGDGDLDLFVGGRVIPGRYPEAASSRLYRAEAGKLRLDAPNSKLLEKIGLVSGAVFSDLDGDGYPELIVACEWGPIDIWRNQRGEFVPWDAPLVWVAGEPRSSQPARLQQLTGWWNGITTGDLDSDGRLDLIASNWGRNTRFQDRLARPLRIYYGDLGGGGGADVLEAYYDPELRKWTPWRDYETIARAIPSLVERIPSFKAYGLAGVEEVLGDRLPAARHLEACTLDSLVLLNRGDHLAAAPLPVEAQFAPAFGVAVGDFDGDGAEDVFLSQNFFEVEPETARYDAGIGLWLRGDGHGSLRAVPGWESGVKVYGQQRGCALADYDHDGRLDLVVAQNGEAIKLFRNQGAKPGLRVRLRGPPGNPTAVGAVVRLKLGAGFGPAREVHAGSGYWSQDGAVMVLGLAGPPSQVWVRWPGGKTTTSDVPAEAKAITVDEAGEVRVGQGP